MEQLGKQLSEEIKQGNLVAVQSIINVSGFDVNGRINRHYTPLQLAIRAKNLGIVEFLLDTGASMDEPFNLLIEAIKYNNIPIVALLISRGAEINEIDDIYNITPFNTAVNMSLESVRLLFETGRINQAELNSGLLKACFSPYGKLEIVQYLVENGADINFDGIISQQLRGTPLLGAILMNKPEIVEYLVLHGADINARPVHGVLGERSIIEAFSDGILGRVLKAKRGRNVRNVRGALASQLVVNRPYYTYKQKIVFPKNASNKTPISNFYNDKIAINENGNPIMGKYHVTTPMNRDKILHMAGYFNNPTTTVQNWQVRTAAAGGGGGGAEEGGRRRIRKTRKQKKQKKSLRIRK